MEFLSLYATNSDWEVNTELTISIIDDNYKAVRASGEALVMACKYGNLEVIAFSKNDVLLKKTK